MAKSKELPKEEIVEEVVEEVDQAKLYAAHMNELVPFYAFRDNGKYKDDIFVSVNNKRWQIKRGQPIMIPRYVYEVLQQSMDQDQKTAEMIRREENHFFNETEKYFR